MSESAGRPNIAMPIAEQWDGQTYYIDAIGRIVGHQETIVLANRLWRELADCRGKVEEAYNKGREHAALDQGSRLASHAEREEADTQNVLDALDEEYKEHAARAGIVPSPAGPDALAEEIFRAFQPFTVKMDEQEAKRFWDAVDRLRSRPAQGERSDLVQVTRGFLESLKCPICDGDGWINNTGPDPVHDGCPWCEARDRFLAGEVPDAAISQQEGK